VFLVECKALLVRTHVAVMPVPSLVGHSYLGSVIAVVDCSSEIKVIFFNEAMFYSATEDFHATTLQSTVIPMNTQL
jgi:hypothetical protein